MAVNGASLRVGKLMSDESKEVLAMLEPGPEGDWGAYGIQVEKELAAMRKKQKLEVGQMMCAGCGGKGSRRCIACFITTYCSLECHVKDWEEGHRGRCKQVREEEVEVVLDPENEDDTKTPRPFFTVKVYNLVELGSKILIRNKDESVFGDVQRPGQKTAYDKLRKAVEELGLEQDFMEELAGGSVVDAGSSMTACFWARYVGKTEDGRIKLKMHVKQVQPMVMW